MEFTYKSYENLLLLLRQYNYSFKTYHAWQKNDRCAILRHDIDQSVDNAVAMAELEAKVGVVSTYFVLLTSEFYNVAAQNTLAGLHKIYNMGHKIGLHFDETVYLQKNKDMEKLILQEANILSKICDFPIKTVSMHRPSKDTLESNLEIAGIVNSYGQAFLHDFKYLSDSRRRWREPVEEIIKSGKYDRLHILTHAFWYHEKEETLEDTVKEFINNGNKARYCTMKNNIVDLPSIMKETEVR